MSRGIGRRGSWPYKLMDSTARTLWGQLMPGCNRIELVGQLRRQQGPQWWLPRIEFLVQPKPILFDLQISRLVAASLIAEGESRAGVYHRRLLAPGDMEFSDGAIPVDVWVARPPADWGVLQVFRTGPEPFWQRMLARLDSIGLRHDRGRIVNQDGQVIPCPNENKFFDVAGEPFHEPRWRR